MCRRVISVAAWVRGRGAWCLLRRVPASVRPLRHTQRSGGGGVRQHNRRVRRYQPLSWPWHALLVVTDIRAVRINRCRGLGIRSLSAPTLFPCGCRFHQDAADGDACTSCLTCPLAGDAATGGPCRAVRSATSLYPSSFASPPPLHHYARVSPALSTPHLPTPATHLRFATAAAGSFRIGCLVDSAGGTCEDCPAGWEKNGYGPWHNGTTVPIAVTPGSNACLSAGANACFPGLQSVKMAVEFRNEGTWH